MEIPAKSPLQSLFAANRSAEALPHPPVEPGGTPPRTATKDTLSLTERGREFKTAAQRALRLPEIREDRVRQLKRQLEAGTYDVKGQRIAASMINESLENNHVLKHIDTHTCHQPTGQSHECDDNETAGHTG